MLLESERFSELCGAAASDFRVPSDSTVRDFNVLPGRRTRCVQSTPGLSID